MRRDYREIGGGVEGLSGVPVDPEKELVVTRGSTEAMMVAMMTACNPGDRVVVFSPFYEHYAADAILAGAIPIFVPLRPPGFGFDPSELEAAFAQRTSAIIVCNSLSKGIPIVEPQGTYYVLADVSALGFESDVDAAHWMARELGVAEVPFTSPRRATNPRSRTLPRMLAPRHPRNRDREKSRRLSSRFPT